MSQIDSLSLGGGLQSTVIAEMALDEEQPLQPPDIIMHADTGSEQLHTIDTVSRIMKLAKKKGVAAEVVKAPEGKLYEWYTERGWVPRVRNGACTDRFKIAPMRRRLKELIDTSKSKPWVTQWIGITLDESHRMRESNVQWIEHRYPLIELQLTRSDCRAWMNQNRPHIKVEKSGCWHCHYQPSKEWLILRRKHPELFQLAVDMEQSAKASGTIKYGLFGGKTIAGFDHQGSTLEEFGLWGVPEDHDCNSSSGGCFL